MQTGNRQHLPLLITKSIDGTSPQIFQALVSDELLTQVTIDFVTNTVDGKELTRYTVVLTNATISDIHQHLDQVQAPASTVLEDRQDLSFTFETIDVTNIEGQNERRLVTKPLICSHSRIVRFNNEG